jgi:hypothetical protein
MPGGATLHKHRTTDSMAELHAGEELTAPLFAVIKLTNRTRGDRKMVCARIVEQVL